MIGKVCEATTKGGCHSRSPLDNDGSARDNLYRQAAGRQPASIARQAWHPHRVRSLSVARKESVSLKPRAMLLARFKREGGGGLFTRNGGGKATSTKDAYIPNPTINARRKKASR